MKRPNVSRGKQRELGLTVTPSFERAKNGVAVGLKYLETWWRQQEYTCNRWNLDIEWLAYFTLFEPKKNFIVRHSKDILCLLCRFGRQRLMKRSSLLWWNIKQKNGIVICSLGEKFIDYQNSLDNSIIN